MAQVEELVELYGVLETDHEVFAVEDLYAEGAVSVLDVDLVEELALGVTEIIAANAGAGSELGQNLLVFVQQFSFHHPVYIEPMPVAYGIGYRFFFLCSAFGSGAITEEIYHALRTTDMFFMSLKKTCY